MIQSVVSQLPTDALRRRIRDSGFNVGVLFVLPALAIMTVILVYPLARTLWLSFHVSEGAAYAWIGLENYRTILDSTWIDTVAVNTVLWTGLTVSLQFVFGLGTAILLNTAFRGRAIVRGLMLLPWVTPGIVAAIIWKWMYHPQFGILNRILVEVGLIENYIAWLTDPDLALLAIIFAGVWKGFPFSMVMYLAGLQSIDEQLYQAAMLDGAPRHARFLHVTLPQLIPILKVTLLLTTIWTFNYFVLVFAMTGGGPAGTTDIFPNKVYKLMFTQFQFGLGSALAIIMFLILMVFMVMYVRALRRQGVQL